MATKTMMSDQEYLQKYGDQLEGSVRRAKWIASVDEHEEHQGQTLATRNHDVIKQWAAERDATPATVHGTEHEGRPGVLRFDFPGYGGQSLEHIGWDKWFESFDGRDLVMLFQEHLKRGNQSNFFRFVSPHRSDA
jgi:hypothetical protein